MTTPNEALRTILPIAGWDDTQAADVVFTGGADPVLPTPFRIGAAGAATLAATGLAATELWQLRTGRRQQVTVDLRQATAALRSGRYLQLAGDGRLIRAKRHHGLLSDPRRALVLISIAIFPIIARRHCGVLGVAEDREAVARAVAKWDAADLEEAIIAAKGAGGMARTQAEWAKHPQGAAVAALPLMEIVRIGDSAPDRCRPAIGRSRASASSTSRASWPDRLVRRTLAEHGADVLKITGAHLPSLGYQELDTGHGKLSAAARPARSGRCRYPARAGAQGRCLLARISSGQLGQPRLLAGGVGRDPAWARLRLALCLRSRRPVGVAARLRHGGANRQRHDDTTGGVRPGKVSGAAILSGLGDRLLHGLLDGVRRDGGIGASGARRRQLAGADLARSSRQVDRRSRRSAAGGARGIPAEFTAGELERWSTVSETPSGRLRHLKPAVQLSETPPYWARPSVPLGYHRPVWP